MNGRRVIAAILLELEHVWKKCLNFLAPPLGIEHPCDYATTFIHALRKSQIKLYCHINIAVYAMVSTNTAAENPNLCD